MAGKFKNMNLGAGLLSDESRNLATNEFQITYIPIDNIVPNEKNDGFSIDEIDELKTSIAEVGLEQNLVVMKHGDKYKLLTGHRRLTALKQLVDEGYEKYETVPCVVKDCNKIDLPLDDETKEIYALATTNAEIRKNTDADRLKLIEMLSSVYDKLKENGYEKLGKRREFIADRLGVSDSTVQMLTYIGNNITDDFRQEFDNNNLPLTVANEIAHMPEEDQQQLYDRSDEPTEITADDVKQFSQKKAEKREKKSIESELQYDTYIFGQEDMNKLAEQFVYNYDDAIVIDKKNYAKILAAQKNIEKQLNNINKIISKIGNKNIKRDDSFETDVD